MGWKARLFGALLCVLAAALYLISVDYVWEPGENTVAIGDSVFREGRKAFYKETFGNELYLSDVVGLASKPLSLLAFAKASLQLAGRGTNNLVVELEEDVVIGQKRFVKGQRIDTGLDVPRGSVMPLGIRFKKAGTSIHLGVTCALCHSTVSENGRVLHGAPNTNLNAGLLLALASNSASFFAFADKLDFEKTDTVPRHEITGPDGIKLTLPDGAKLETAVDERFSHWPPGTFDTTPDLVASPTKIPSVFLRGSGWSPTIEEIRRVHGLGLNTVCEAPVVAPAMGIRQMTYAAIVLQNAPSAAKNSVAIGEIPSCQAIPENAAQSILAWENAIEPPHLVPDSVRQGSQKGATVFLQAGCAKCHTGGSRLDRTLASVKAPGLLGLYWRAPYLADGGVAVGFGKEEWGLPITALSQRPIDPVASLDALLDRKQRSKVVLANESHPDLRQVRIKGDGHPYWVDKQSGFSDELRQELIAFLLSNWKEGDGGSNEPGANAFRQ